MRIQPFVSRCLCESWILLIAPWLLAISLVSSACVRRLWVVFGVPVEGAGKWAERDVWFLPMRSGTRGGGGDWMGGWSGGVRM